LVQASSPSSPEYSEGLSPVAYFESLTPDLRSSDDEWSFKSIEGMSTSDDEPHFILSPRLIERRRILNEKKMIRLGLKNSIVEKNNIEEAPKEGLSISLNGAFIIFNNTGDENNDYKGDKNNYKVDDNINNNKSNDEEAFINDFNQLFKSMLNIPGSNQLSVEQVNKDCVFSLLRTKPLVRDDLLEVTMPVTGVVKS
jgi:hypothetical protein